MTSPTTSSAPRAMQWHCCFPSYSGVPLSPTCTAMGINSSPDDLRGHANPTTLWQRPRTRLTASKYGCSTALEPGVVPETLSAQLWVQEQKAPVSMREAEGMVEHPASHSLRHHMAAPLRPGHAQPLLDQRTRSRNGSGQGQLDLGSSSYLLPWCGQLRSDRTSQEMSWTRVVQMDREQL